MSVIVSTLGFPRIGPRRELKTALERYWSGTSSAASLMDAASGLRAAAWARQRALGVIHIPSNDFSLYDHVLDTSAMVGAIPAIYGRHSGDVPLDTYFAMARGSRDAPQDDARNAHDPHCAGLRALEMTKWFDTNYHYMVPELTRDQAFALTSTKPILEYREATQLGFRTRPVLVGPVTYLKLAKNASKTAPGSADASFDLLSLLPVLLPVYTEVLRSLAANGAEWVQMDEPCLVLDLDKPTRDALRLAYGMFARAVPNLKIMLTTYFGGLGDNLDTALSLPVVGLHLDLVRAPLQLDHVLAKAPNGLVLSLGIVDGRNVWRSDLSEILNRIEPAVSRRGTDHIMVAPSCSLLHVPLDLEAEDSLDPQLRNWLAFGIQKIGELATLAKAINEGRSAVRDALDASAAAAATRRTSPAIHNPAVNSSLAAITPAMARRHGSFANRKKVQDARLGLPVFPTTSIGSFPQTESVRKARAAHARGTIKDAEYEHFLRQETEAAVRWQEEIGIDVLVHGEFERNDMVQYFGEQLAGFAFTKHGWVQSYGSRCVRPPIIFGDVSRPRPMTVEWSSFAQSLTRRPMKGMLTGPVTLMQWSFVRDDVPRSTVCRQIALALRDEVADLEKAGIRIIQIDEPAIREGLPLRRGDWRAYLEWAVECFKLASCGVEDATQIHTHMCYSEFNDIIDAIAALDADVISIETARSKMELLAAFTSHRYPNDIGPGIYDIHAPRCPSVEEMSELLALAGKTLSPRQIWVNPDCGLKTRNWDEVRPALENMVRAAISARQATLVRPE